ncbi:MAG: hypothetical protein K1000chlam4_00946 [Chlamydiae bacterium]|nr:hypothetical protein [Chlamydiota bacterium]
MEGICLKIYVDQIQKHGVTSLYEWILEEAKKKGIHGETAFKAIAGYGRDMRLHEEHFYELGSNVPILVEFVVTKEEVETLLGMISEKKIKVFYTKHPVEFFSLA